MGCIRYYCKRRTSLISRVFIVRIRRLVLMHCCIATLWER